MRELLFRAKRKNWAALPEEEWWVEGYPVKYQPCASKDEYVYGIVPTYASALYIIAVNPETLCQYICMNDKNGKRIYENDIIRHDKSDTIGTVQWYQEDYVGWCVYDIQVDEQQVGDETWGECEVIGNIFDHPKLLKGE